MIMLQKLPLQSIGLSQIVPDEKFQISSSGPDDKLKESIAQIGLTTPLVVQEESRDRFLLICGYKRLACLQDTGGPRVPAFVTPEDGSYVDLLLFGIKENLAVRSFSPVEVSNMIYLAEKYAAMDRADIVRKIFPLLEFGRNPKIYDLYRPLRTLSNEWKKALENETVAPETAFLMNGVSGHDQAGFLSLVVELRLGRNRQREFWGLLADVARLQDLSVSELLHGEHIQSVLAENRLTPSQKTERIKGLLWHWRYPRYSQTRDRFEAILSEAKLPPEIHLQPPPFFEGEKFQISFSFVSGEDYAGKIGLLAKLENQKIVQKLVGLV